LDLPRSRLQLLASSRALLRRRSCVRHTRWRAVSPSSSSHHATEAASSDVLVKASIATGGLAARTSSAADCAISAVYMVAICASAYAVRTGRSPHGEPSALISVFATSAAAAEPISNVHAPWPVHFVTLAATSSSRSASSS
jgi:hypothetical protein